MTPKEGKAIARAKRLLMEAVRRNGELYSELMAAYRALKDIQEKP